MSSKENTSVSGFLHMEDSSGQLVLRFFQLNTVKGLLLFYSADPRSLPTGSAPLGSIPLQYVSQITDTSKQKPKSVCSFIVIIEGKKHTFLAASSEEVTKWVTVLNNLCKITVPRNNNQPSRRDRSVSDPIASHSYTTDIVGGVVQKRAILECDSTDDDLYSSSDEEGRVHLTSQKVIHVGYCVKQGAVVKNWKRRFFVLTEEALSYYKSEQHWKDKKAPIKSILLERIIETRESKGIHPNRDNLLEVVTPKRVFYVQSDTPGDMVLWLKNINILLAKKRGVTQTKSDAGSQTTESLRRNEVDPGLLKTEHSIWV